MQYGILLGIQVTINKGARSTHVLDIIAAQFACKDAWAKRSVSTNIETP
jgi:hypothetical protein